jgi:hypothetical protein
MQRKGFGRVWRAGGLARLRVAAAALAFGGGCLAISAPARADAEPAQLPAPPPEQEATAPQPPWNARQAAWADGLSTALAMSQGAVERNPLVGSTPAALLAATGAKLGLVELVDRSNLTPEQRHRTLNAMAALWGGASINNLLILLSAQPPVAMLAGVAGGLWMWRRHGAPEAPDAVVAHVPWPNASGE